MLLEYEAETLPCLLVIKKHKEIEACYGSNFTFEILSIQIVL